jgi:hypothetical protein
VRVQLRRFLLGILLGRSPRRRQLQGRLRLRLLPGVSRAAPKCFRCLLAGLQPLKYTLFSPLPTGDLGFSADLAPLAPIFKFTLLGTLQIPKPCFAPPSLAGVAVLGEKLRSPSPWWFLSLFSVTTGGRRN